AAAETHNAEATKTIQQTWRKARDVKRLNAAIFNEERRLGSIIAKRYYEQGKLQKEEEANERARKALTKASTQECAEPGAALLNAALLEAEEASRSTKATGQLSPESRAGFEQALEKLESYATRRGRNDDVLLANRAKVLVLFAEAVEGPNAKEPPQ